MTETEYFGHLEMRVSRELEGMRQPELRSCWCDGFLPEKFVVTRSGSHVAGRVWMDPGKGKGVQSLWNFVLLLGPRPMQRDEVQWAELLPADEATGWLFLDFDRRFMKIKLSAAFRTRRRPDNPPGGGLEPRVHSLSLDGWWVSAPAADRAYVVGHWPWLPGSDERR